MEMHTQVTGMFKCPECGMIIHMMTYKRHYKEYHPKLHESDKEPKEEETKRILEEELV